MSNSSIITPETLRRADEEYIVAVLEAMKIPYKTWGKGKSTKTLENFVADWREGKITWEPETSSTTFEKDIALVTVTWEINNFKRELREKYREFKNGQLLKDLWTKGSLAETLKHHDTSYLAGLRGLSKKLGQTKPGFRDPSRFRLVTHPRNQLEPRPSVNYPGFDVQLTYWPIICLIDEHLYEEEYSYQEPDKTTYWHWIDVPQNVRTLK